MTAKSFRDQYFLRLNQCQNKAGSSGPQCRNRSTCLAPGSPQGQSAFTVVEAAIALVVLMIFFLGSTVALNLFDTRAAQNRNAEAARAIMDDYVNSLLDDATTSPIATGNGTDIDGDGTPDGVICSAIGKRVVPNPLPLVATRSIAPTSQVIVPGTLYWKVQNVGIAMGLPNDTDLAQVNFLLSYTYRGKSYYYRMMTYKAKV